MLRSLLVARAIEEKKLAVSHAMLSLFRERFAADAPLPFAPPAELLPALEEEWTTLAAEVAGAGASAEPKSFSI